MTTTRLLTRALCSLALIVAARSPAPAAGDATPYFCRRLSSSPLERVAPGPDGSVCVAGTTVEPELLGAIDPPDPTQTFHGFVTVLGPDGRVRWSQFLPRSWIQDVRVAADGAIWSAGQSPSYAPAYDPKIASVTKIGADGTVLANLDLGGSGEDHPTGLALDPCGDVIVVGTTTSSDFPLVNAFQPTFGGNTDGFVARIRGDGSGIVWSSYIGGAGFDDANAVAVDANGDILVTTRERWGDLTYYPTEAADRVRAVTSVSLTRISGDGAVISTLPLPRGDFGGAFDVAIAPDGRILVGGVIGFRDRGPQEGYVVPVDPATSTIGLPWHEADREVHRISVGPGGEVLVGTDRDWDDSTGRRAGGGFILLTSDLATVLRRVDREEHWGVLDVAFAPDGALCIGTQVGSAAAPFPVAPGPFYGGESVVGRLPAIGPQPPSRVTVRHIAATEAVLSWTRDADAVVGYDVEEDTSDLGGLPWIRTFRRVGRASAKAHAVRVRGLCPGSTHHLRLVANFASGVRTAVSVPVVRTPPARVRRVDVETLSGWPGIYVTWDCGGNGDRTFVEFERSVGLGPFEPVRGYYRSVGYCDGWFHDRDVRREDGFIIYRVRAVTVAPRVATPWTYSGWALAR